VSPIALMARPAPHKLLLLAVQVILGVAYTVGVPPPTSVSATQPPLAVHLWALAMLVSGSVGLIANVYRRLGLSMALRLERGAMDLGAAAMMLYAVSLIGYAGLSRALASALICLFWAAANIWRGLQIRRDVKELSR
jgi:hypothetical protein